MAIIVFLNIATCFVILPCIISRYYFQWL